MICSRCERPTGSDNFVALYVSDAWERERFFTGIVLCGTCVHGATDRKLGLSLSEHDIAQLSFDLTRVEKKGE